MLQHKVRAHVRRVSKRKLTKPNPLVRSLVKSKIVHVRSYQRGNEKPQAKLLVKPVPVPKPSDPEREKVDKLVSEKLQEVINKANANKGPYWNKIANFQLNFNGREWKIVDSYDTGGYGNYEDCQLCGHKGCRFMYVIASGDKKMTIGDECVINYIKDLNTKEIFKKHEKRLRGLVSKTKSYHDLLVDILLWESKNGTNSFLTDMKNKVLNGMALSQNMVSAIKRTIAHDIPKRDLEAKNNVLETFNKARSKAINDWERNFIISVGEYIQKGYTLSANQMNVLERIANYK